MRKLCLTETVGQTAAQLQQLEHGLDEDNVDDGGEMEEWPGGSEEGDDDDFAEYFDNDRMADEGGEMGRGSFGPAQNVYHEDLSLAPSQSQDQSKEIQSGLAALYTARSAGTSTVAESAAVSRERPSNTSNGMMDVPDWMTGFSGLSDFTFALNDAQHLPRDLSGNTSDQPEPPSRAAQLSDLEAFFNKEWPIVHFKTLDLNVAHPALVESIYRLSVWVKNEAPQSISHQAANELITSELLSQPVSF